jgi:hypothetical protein
MSRIDNWFSEKPRPRPAEIACFLAGDRFWKDERRRLIATHPDWPDAVYLLDLNEELAHALVLVLSRLPAPRRRDFADAFYSERHGGAESVPEDPHRRLGLAAAVVLDVLDSVDDRAATFDDRTLDLLRGAAQGDDLTRTPAPAVDALRRTIARIRFDPAFEDPANPRGAAAFALAEVLDPAGEVVDFKEVLARSAWAVVETREPPEVLRFLLDVDRLLAVT